MEQNTEPESEKTDPEPKVIGLTGGIGSGKTTVAQMIEKMGFPVYNSDFRAKEVVYKDEVKSEIIKLLGEKSFDENQIYNRKFVSEKIFNNDALLTSLNSIIHPAVKIDFENWVNQQNSAFVFKETALLFELKLNEQCYKSILVTAEDKLRMKRVMDRDTKTYREIEAIMLKQMPEKQKCKLADYIIYNNSTLESLETETQIVIQKIMDLE